MIRKGSLNRQTAAKWSVRASLAAFCFAIIGVLFVVLEARGFIHSGIVTEWRPLFLVWAACALVASSLLILQIKRLSRTETNSAIGPGAGPVPKILLGLAALAVAISLEFEPLSSAVLAAFERQWPSAPSGNAIKDTIKVSIDCASCARSLEDTLRKRTLAEKAEVNLATSEVGVWFDPNKTSREAIVQVLRTHHFLTGEENAHSQTDSPP